MFCPKCGTQNSEGQKLCFGCGEALPCAAPVQMPPKKNGALIAVIIILSVCMIAIAGYLIYRFAAPSSTTDEERTPAAEQVQKPTEASSSEASSAEAPAPTTEAVTTEAETTTEINTIAPTEPAQMLDDPDVQYRINIFLSNFSEQYFDSYPADDFAMLHFAYLYNKINARENITSENYDYCISADIVDETTNRFFGKTVARQTLSHTDEWGFEHIFEYRDGKYCTPAADGEIYNSFSVVSKMTQLESGTYLVYFDVYALDYEVFFEHGLTSSYYSLTAAQAAADSDLIYCYSGCATVTDYSLGDYPTYQLLAYEYYH